VADVVAPDLTRLVAEFSCRGARVTPFTCPPSTRHTMTTWDLAGSRQLILLCNGDTCSEHGADQVTLTLRRELQARHLDPQVHTARTRCMGRCDDACTVVVMPDNIWYRNVTPALAQRIVTEHLVSGRAVEEIVSFAPGGAGLVQLSGTMPGKAKPA
jgi:(2Fe-2S) ferredoxin